MNTAPSELANVSGILFLSIVQKEGYFDVASRNRVNRNYSHVSSMVPIYMYAGEIDHVEFNKYFLFTIEFRWLRSFCYRDYPREEVF